MASSVTLTTIPSHTGFYQTGAMVPGLRVMAVIPKAALQLKYPRGAPSLVGAASAATKNNTTVWNITHNLTQIDITDFVTSIGWSASTEQNFVEVSIDLDNRGQLFNWLPPGTLFLLQSRSPRWRAGGQYSTFLSVYMFEIERTNEGGSETMSVTAYDRLKWMGESKPGNKTYKVDKRHKRGWTSRQIIADICKRVKMPVGSLGIRNIYIKKIELKGDALEQVNAVIKHVAQKTPEKNDKYRIHAANGKMNIVKTITDTKKVKSALLFNDSTGLENANLSIKPKEGFATQLKVIPSTKWRTQQWKNSKHKGKVPKGYKSDAIIVNPTDKNIQKVFGIITKENKEIGRKHNLSRAGLIRLARGELNRQMAFIQEAQFTARGQLGIWPETWVYLASARLGVRGLFSVKSVSYTLSGGVLTMTLTVDLSEKPRMARSGVEALLNSEPIRY